MKIISGIYKGRNIEGFELDGTRPTMDRIKESLFAMIQNNLRDAIVLDLFSGTGNLGIEALSNGAKFAYLVDYNKKAINTINTNIKNIKVENAEVIHADYKKALIDLKNKNIKFDIIFLDPPYNTNYIEESNRLIEEYDLLAKDGIIICESSSIDRIIFNNFKVVKDRKYKDKYIVILKK